MNTNDITIVGNPDPDSLIEIAIVNKQTGIVENMIVVNNLPNYEDDVHAFIPTYKEVDVVTKGWKYDFENYKFWTDNPNLVRKYEYSKEELLRMEESAWEKMLEEVRRKALEQNAAADVP